MDDLISRAYVLAEYDRQHKGPPGGERKIMEEAPAVDAIPIEWLKEQIAEAPDSLWASLIESVMNQWQKEQEAR